MSEWILPVQRRIKPTIYFDEKEAARLSGKLEVGCQ